MYNKPCIYMQVEPGSPEQSDIDEEDEEAAAAFSPELRLVPRDSDKCMALFLLAVFWVHVSAQCPSYRTECSFLMLSFVLKASIVSEGLVHSVQEMFQALCDCAALNPDNSLEGDLLMPQSRLPWTTSRVQTLPDL